MRSKICDCLYDNAKRFPKKEAICFDDSVITYNAFSKMVARFSNAFIMNDIGFQDHLCILLENSIEVVAILFACAELGICAVPLNTTLPGAAIESALIHTKTTSLISNSCFLNKFGNNISRVVAKKVFCIDGVLNDYISLCDINSFSDLRPNVDINCNESLFVLSLTSGSTGNPKAIELTQKNKLDRVNAHIDFFGINETDRIAVSTLISHSLAERMSILPLVVGGSLIIMPPDNCEKWVSLSKKYSPTFTITTPYQLASVVDYLKKNTIQLNSYKKIVSSSDTLNNSLKEGLLHFFNCDIYEIYGTSETSTVTAKKIDNDSNNTGVGFPFYGSDIIIIRDEGSTDSDSIAQTNEIGEIACKSRLLANNYFNAKTQYEMSFFDGYFKTGDIGFIDSFGEIHFVGRKKEIIKKCAMNVYPYDIESVVEKMPEVEECAAFSHPDGNMVNEIGLAVVPSSECVIREEYIYNFCKKNLAEFQQPKYIYLVNALPKNAIGKVQRLRIYNYLAEYGVIKSKKGDNYNEQHRRN